MSAVIELLRQEKIDLHVSVSSCRTLESCRRQWWYRYVEGAPQEDTPSRLLLGTAVHKALAFYYQSLKDVGEPPPVEKVFAVAGAVISMGVVSDPPVIYGPDEDAEGLVLEAQRLLTVFLEKGFRPAKVIAVEEPFAVALRDPTSGRAMPFEEKLIGAIDLVAEDEDGTLVVVDHKVTSRVDSSLAERADLQMATYSRVAKELFGVSQVQARLQCLVRNKEAKVVMQDVSCSARDEDHAARAVASALALANTVIGHLHGKLMMGRQKSWRCKDCSWRRRCAADRE